MHRRELLKAAITAAFAWRPKQTLYARVVKNNGAGRLWKIEPPCVELQKFVESMADSYGPLDWKDERWRVDASSWLNEHDASLRRPFIFDDAIFASEGMLWQTSEDELRRLAFWSGVTLEFWEG